MKYVGQTIRVSCKRCGRQMLKWQRHPLELENMYPYLFDGICGQCLTLAEVNFNRKTEGLIMAFEKQIEGVFTYNSASKKFNKFIFEAQGGVVGNVFFPKDIKHVPSRIILDSDIRRAIEMHINDSGNK